MAGKLQPTADPLALRIRSLAAEEKKLEAWAKDLECTLKEASGYLAGTLRPSWVRLVRFVDVFHVSPTWLMYGLGPKDIRKFTAQALPHPSDQEVMDAIKPNGKKARRDGRGRKRRNET